MLKTPATEDTREIVPDKETPEEVVRLRAEVRELRLRLAIAEPGFRARLEDARKKARAIAKKASPPDARKKAGTFAGLPTDGLARIRDLSWALAFFKLLKEK